MQQQAVHLHAGIAFERIAKVAILPSREGFDHEHLELLLAHAQRRFLRVVFGVAFVRRLRNRERELHLAGLLRFPRDGVLITAHRGQRDLFGEDLTARRFHFEHDDLITRQRAVDDEGNAQRFARHGEGGYVKAAQLDIRQPRLRSHGHGKHRHLTHAQSRGGLRRR